MDSLKKKIFIDCGTHMFQGFKQFVEILKIDSSWECYSFEANPITYGLSKNIYIEFHERFCDDIEFYKTKKIKYVDIFNKNGLVFHEWQ